MELPYRGVTALPLTILAAALVFTGCSVERTRTGEAPEVDVDVDPGSWPRYNVKWADVDVGTATRTVTVPKLEWKREQMEVQVPYIDINPPGGGDREDRTVAVELEVPTGGYDLAIREVRAAGDDLWVISELKRTGATTGGPTRVSDQLVVKAPEDLDVHHFVVGQRPEGVYNQQYSFYPDMSALQQRLPQGGGRVIYQRNI